MTFERRNRISAIFLVLFCFTWLACGSSTFVDPIGSALHNARCPLLIPTYDGSGQATEPDVTSFDLPWHGFRYWMAVSPYPFADQSKENPSIFASNDGTTWRVPPGVTNPLALPIGKNYLSDASIFYDRNSDQLWIYYNVTYGIKPVTGLGLARLVSADGSHWHSDGEILHTGPCEVTSPTVGQVANVYFLWSIVDRNCDFWGQTVATYRTSADGVTWSDPSPTTMFIPGYLVWHINVTYIPSKREWWAAVAAYPNTKPCCDHTSLFFARSQDGVHWTCYKTPILNPASSSWDNQTIYRSSCLFDSRSNDLRVWYSAMDTKGKWGIGFTEENYDILIDWLAQMEGVPTTPTLTVGARICPLGCPHY